MTEEKRKKILDAFSKAGEIRSGLDTCVEYENAYIFSSIEDERNPGSTEPVAVLKENGECCGLRTYIINFAKSPDITGEYSISENTVISENVDYQEEARML